MLIFYHQLSFSFHIHFSHVLQWGSNKFQFASSILKWYSFLVLCCPCTAAIYRVSFPTTASCRWIWEKNWNSLDFFCEGLGATAGFLSDFCSKMKDLSYLFFPLAYKSLWFICWWLVLGYKANHNKNDAVLVLTEKLSLKWCWLFACLKSLYT